MVYLSKMNLEVSEELKYESTRMETKNPKLVLDTSGMIAYTKFHFNQTEISNLVIWYVGISMQACFAGRPAVLTRGYWMMLGGGARLLDGSKIENSKPSVCIGL